MLGDTGVISVSKGSLSFRGHGGSIQWTEYSDFITNFSSNLKEKNIKFKFGHITTL